MLCSDSGARIQSLTPRSRFSDLCGFGGIWPFSPPSQTLIDALPILFIKCIVLSASHGQILIWKWWASLSACSYDPSRMALTERLSHVGRSLCAGFGTVWIAVLAKPGFSAELLFHCESCGQRALPSVTLVMSKCREYLPQGITGLTVL